MGEASWTVPGAAGKVSDNPLAIEIVRGESSKIISVMESAV